MKARIFYTILAPIVVCIMAWLGGFDFDKRGFVAWVVFYCSFFSALFTWMFLGIGKK